MRLSVKLTLDGMVRALRWKAHALAEDAGHGYVEPGLKGISATPRRSPLRREDEDDDRRK